MRTTISIVCYNQIDKVQLCINSIFNGGGDFDLILTANGDSAIAAYFQKLAEEHSNVRVVVNPENLGFIEPNKHALAMTETELFCMVNDDCILPFGWLGKITRIFHTSPNAAIVGPKGCRLRDNFFGGLEGKPVEYIEGVCLAIPTQFAKQYGLFDPELKWAYGEDSDLSLRMRSLGYTIHLANFPIYHKPGSTSCSVKRREFIPLVTTDTYEING
jgi:GT2 family glycosyltransferase